MLFAKVRGDTYKTNETKMDKIMKSMVKQVEDLVIQLSEKYGFDKAEALEFIMPAGEAVRGRPSKPKKKVVNKTEMVEDVIKTIMEGELAHVADAPVTNIAQTEPVIVASEEGLKVEAPIKKKAAPKKKKAEAPVTEAATEVAVVAQAAPIASESGVTAMTVEEGEKTAKAVAALMEARTEDAKEKKKAAPKKKKAEAAVVEVAAVAAAVPEPVIVAEKKADAPEGGLKGDAPLVEAPRKKKAAPKKKKADAEAVVVEPVTEVAVVAQAEPVIVAAVVEAPLKKKAAPKKKKADAAVAVVETPKPVVETPKPVVEAPKPVVEAPKPVVEAPKPATVEAQGGVKGDTPLSEEESAEVKEWVCKKDGTTYFKCCEDNCDIEDCNCCGSVYSKETQDHIGHWNGSTIVLAADDEEEEEEDIDWP